MTSNDVRSLLQIAIKAIGGDGLCNPDSECGCGTDDLAPCGCINLSECVAAKYRAGYYRAIE